MVRKLSVIILSMSMFFLLSITVCASEEVRVEQLNATMPNMDVYFYSDEEIEEATLELPEEIISTTRISEVGEQTNHYFFLVDCSGSISDAHM